jgi:hypothetical protein
MISKRQFVRSSSTDSKHVAASVARLVATIAMGGILAAASGCTAQVGGGGEGEPRASESTATSAAPLEAEQKAGGVTTESTSCRPPFYNCVCRIDGELQSFCTTPALCWHICPDL